jgi:parvulin-like peptidyl-prolyl isomerase
MLYNSGDAAQQAVALVSQIRGGAPFSDIARRYSSDHSAANGGQMGPDDYTFLQQLLPRRVSELIPRMQLGEVSDPIETPEGIYILRVDARDR